MASTDAAFAELMNKLEYSLFIVTALGGEEPAGCLIGFASQVSIDPGRFLACLSNKNRTHRVALEANRLAVHLVPEDAEELAELFGGQTGDDIDKFERCRWRPGPGGIPILCDLENWFCGRVMERFPFGDHTGFLLEPTDVHTQPAEKPLTFRRARRIEPGHEP